jgi:hypothetical protein
LNRNISPNILITISACQWAFSRNTSFPLLGKAKPVKGPAAKISLFSAKAGQHLVLTRPIGFWRQNLSLQENFSPLKHRIL